MATIKVFQGTRSVDAPRLCDSCDSGLIMRGAADSEEQVFCLRMRKHVTTRVTECNQYVDRTQPPLWALKEQAWVLHVDAKRQKIGFLTSKAWRQLHEDEDLIPGNIA
ncbi:MAG TPA: hypothetical protein VEV17_00110 [Bryobacteraceae bacterium]|nr:hypothetical protein [Bryobacteraceae bacterium]